MENLLKNLLNDNEELKTKMKNKSFELGFMEGVKWDMLSDKDKGQKTKEQIAGLNHNGAIIIPKLEIEDIGEFVKGLKVAFKAIEQYKK